MTIEVKTLENEKGEYVKETTSDQRAERTDMVIIIYNDITIPNVVSE